MYKSILKKKSNQSLTVILIINNSLSLLTLCFSGYLAGKADGIFCGVSIQRDVPPLYISLYPFYTPYIYIPLIYIPPYIYIPLIPLIPLYPLLPIFYQTFTKLLPNFYQTFTKLLPNFYQTCLIFLTESF